MNKMSITATAVVISVSLVAGAVLASTPSADSTELLASTAKVTQQTSPQQMSTFNVIDTSAPKIVKQFKDIKGHWAESAIKKAAEDGYLTGYSDGTFRPNSKITRAELVAIITRISKLEKKSSNVGISDVPANNWAHGAINNAIGTGFLKSSDYKSGVFKPNEAATRYEVAQWLGRGLVLSEKSFEEAYKDLDGDKLMLPFSEYFKGKLTKEQRKVIALVRGTGLMTGNPDGTFGVNDNTTRAEVAAMIVRYQKIEGSKADTYLSLKELREIAQTGTNLETIGNVKWNPNLAGKIYHFKEYAGKEIKLRNGKGTLSINYYVVINQSKEIGSPERGIFSEVFEKESVREKEYLAVVNYTVVTNKELSGPEDLYSQIAGVTGTSISGEFVKRYGMSTLPDTFGFPGTPNSINDVVTVGEPYTVWTRRAVGAKQSVEISTLDGIRASFWLVKM